MFWRPGWLKKGEGIEGEQRGRTVALRCLILFFSVCLFLPFLTVPYSIWDLSSLIRDQTYVPCISRWILNHWTTREVPLKFYICLSSPTDLSSPWGQCPRCLPLPPHHLAKDCVVSLHKWPCGTWNRSNARAYSRGLGRVLTSRIRGWATASGLIRARVSWRACGLRKIEVISLLPSESQIRDSSVLQSPPFLLWSHAVLQVN